MDRSVYQAASCDRVGLKQKNLPAVGQGGGWYCGVGGATVDHPVAGRAQVSLLDRLGEGQMRMREDGDVFNRDAVLQAHDALHDYICSAGADDMYAHYLC